MYRSGMASFFRAILDFQLVRIFPTNVGDDCRGVGRLLNEMLLEIRKLSYITIAFP